MTNLFLGLDVGAKGGIAAIDETGRVYSAFNMPESDRDLFDALVALSSAVPCRAVLEKVHSTPQMGVASAFSFGAQFGRVRMALAAAGITYDPVTPFTWQKKLQCLSGGDKVITKARAQQLFPTAKVTHLTADALLLAEYCRLTQYVEQVTR